LRGLEAVFALALPETAAFLFPLSIMLRCTI
jgi:hypothetical protein